MTAGGDGMGGVATTGGGIVGAVVFRRSFTFTHFPNLPKRMQSFDALRCVSIPQL